MSLITTRVRRPDKDDWRKLWQVIQYIRSTINMQLILRADNQKIVKWWVEASYAMHMDFWSHTEATMYLGWGSVISMYERKI